MPIPLFYNTNKPVEGFFYLEEEASKHITQVLRMNAGERLRITDGKGNLYEAEISAAHKRHTVAAVQQHLEVKPPEVKTALAISLLKNTARFEWFIEKATEFGIGSIIPLICDRTERQKFRMERIRHIMVSAMLQSQQAWLPEISEPQKFSVSINTPYVHKYIAHCENREGKLLLAKLERNNNSIVFIGPEGDFSTLEIDAALDMGVIQVSLGQTRLRTETAGILAAAMLTHY